jgi:hypothetical protein
MTPRHPIHQLFPILALSMTLALAASAGAQTYQSSGPSASLDVTFGHSPHWVGVPGTRVREIRTADRPDYDMFNYGGSYYAYQNNHWYRSQRSRGRFTAIDDRRVPTQLSRVPRDHWHNYPAGWQDQNQNTTPRTGYDNRRR